jgi:hypothetical protein
LHQLWGLVKHEPCLTLLTYKTVEEITEVLKQFRTLIVFEGHEKLEGLSEASCSIQVLIRAVDEVPAKIEFTDILIEKLRENHLAALRMNLQLLKLKYCELTDYLLAANVQDTLSKLSEAAANNILAFAIRLF